MSVIDCIEAINVCLNTTIQVASGSSSNGLQIADLVTPTATAAIVGVFVALLKLPKVQAFLHLENTAKSADIAEIKTNTQQIAGHLRGPKPAAA